MRSLSASLVLLALVVPSVGHAEPSAPPLVAPAAPASISATAAAPVTSSVAPVAATPAPAPAAQATQATEAGAPRERAPEKVPRADAREADAPATYQPPTVVDYYGGRIPRDSSIEERPRAAFVATGIAMAGTAYGGALLYAIGTCGAQMDCRNGSAWLYAPLIGPFLTAGQAPTSGGRALAIFDGSLQTVGVALFVAGFLAPKKVVVTYQNAAWRVEPVQMGSGMGLGLTVVNR